MPLIELSDDEIFTLQAAVENLRSADRNEATVDAAWRIASKLEALAKRANEAATNPLPVYGSKPVD